MVLVSVLVAPASDFVLVIDAGHGGDDPGKIGINDALEKDINLSVSFLIDFIHNIIIFNGSFNLIN